MQPAAAYNGLKSLVKYLGGPSLDDADIDAALKFQGGKVILDWLESQLPFVDGSDTKNKSNTDSGSTDDSLERRTIAAFREITLEKEEGILYVSVDFQVSRTV